MINIVITTEKEKTNHENIFSWLRQHTDKNDFGKMIVDKSGNRHPIHCNTNLAILNWYNYKTRWLKSLSNKDYRDHFNSDETYYFTCSKNDNKHSESLLMIDIDCHKTGSLSGAKAFAQHLRDNYFPDLYYEVSTHGNGVHCYLRVQKGTLSSETLNELFGRLEFQLKRILSETDFDVELVEIKGTAPVYTWGNNNNLLTYRSGTLAKLPREQARFDDELRHTTLIDANLLLRLPKVPKVEAINNGSCTGKAISADELAHLKTTYLRLAKSLLPSGTLATECKARFVVTQEDIAIAIMIIKHCTNNMEANGALPSNRIQKMWESLFDCGDVTRQYVASRFAVIRGLLTTHGLIDWTDDTYCLGYFCNGEWVKGRAAKWCFTASMMDQLTELFDEKKGEASSQDTLSDEIIKYITEQPKQPLIRPHIMYVEPVVIYVLPDHVPIPDYQQQLAA